MTLETMRYEFPGYGIGIDSAFFYRVRKAFRGFGIPLTAILQIDEWGAAVVTEVRWTDAGLDAWKRAFILRALRAADR